MKAPSFKLGAIIVRFRWLLLLPSFLSVFLFSSVVQARQLVFWRFDSNQNRLVFTTDEGVQPRAQLIANPTRVVIDLPATRLGRGTTNQLVGGAIREVRVGQFDTQTTRIVIELAPGYTIDPQQVKFRGASPTQWTVDLPTPQRVEQLPPLAPSPNPPTTQFPQPTPPNPVETSGTVLDGFQVTRDGFFVRTNGGEPRIIKVQRSRDRQRIDIDLEGITFPANLSGQNVVVNRYGVSQIQFSQPKTSPPTVRMTLNVTRESPDWQALFSSTGGIVVLPLGTSASNLDNPLISTPPRPGTPNQPVSNTQLATIQSVELGNNQTQLLIQADRRITGTTTWDATAGAYRITLFDAQLAQQVRGPQLTPNSPLSRILLRQQDSRTVVILAQPSPGTQLGELNQVSDRLLAIQVQQRSAVLPPNASIPVPPPTSFPTPPVTSPNPPISQPRVPNSRILVIVDPGHGGKDPGTIGIGGVQEKNVILPISIEVAQILEQQGVQAILTRSDDTFVSLEGRVQMAERANADLFVSIHANAISLSRPEVNGLETYYYSSGQRLAQTVHNSILQSVDVGNRGVRQARFYVLRRSSMPSILVEVGFLTGRDDSAKLANPTYRSQMAQAIARGILQYIQQNP
ncbi:MAG TPA: N-acetylmuramoyl-L-alanine amidase [Cyanobacteria bacterium UBA11162]|nr:N-acetylmuramoyl-L-alanine amidase [Cyanobacteria bacterium UBA11162]